jgi:hypothetical protein
MAARIIPVNYFDQATLNPLPNTPLPSMPFSNLQSNASDRVWRSDVATSNQQVNIYGQWGNGDSRSISSFIVWPGPAGAIGTKVRLVLYSDFGNTVVYDSATQDFFPVGGQTWGTFAWGAQPWSVDPTDRTARLAPYILYFPKVTACYFAIAITSTAAMDQSFFEASRVWLGDYVDAPYNANYGAQPGWKSGTQLSRTPGGSLRRLARAKWRELRFDVNLDTEVARSTWSDVVSVCDPSKDVVVSLFPGDANKKLERDFTVMGSLEALNPIVFQNYNLHNLQMAVLAS